MPAESGSATADWKTGHIGSTEQRRAGAVGFGLTTQHRGEPNLASRPRSPTAPPQRGQCRGRPDRTRHANQPSGESLSGLGSDHLSVARRQGQRTMNVRASVRSPAGGLLVSRASVRFRSQERPDRTAIDNPQPLAATGRQVRPGLHELFQSVHLERIEDIPNQSVRLNDTSPDFPIRLPSQFHVG
jgi:hypothetical protein